MSTTIHPPVVIDAATAEVEPRERHVVARTRGRLRVWLILLVLAAAGVVGWRVLRGPGPGAGASKVVVYEVARRSFPVEEEVKGELAAAKTTDIKCKVEGRTTIIWLIEEGKTVEKDELLVRLASDKIEERIRQEEANEASAIASLEAAEKDLEILIDENKSNIRKGETALRLAVIDRDKYVEGDARKKLMEVQLEVDRAKQMYERALAEYESSKGLYENRYIPKTDLDQKQFNLSEAERSVAKAEKALETFNKYEYPREILRLDSDKEEKEKELERVRKSALAKEAQKNADVEAKRANLLNTQNQLNKFREQLSFCEIRAPTPGLVVYNTGYRWDPQKITEGSEVHERQTIVTLPDSSVMLVKVRIHEAKTSKIHEGQNVTVEIDAIPDRVFTGKVTRIAPLADSRNEWINPDLKEYETEITLDQHDPLLKPGVTARVKIAIGQVNDQPSIPPQAVFSKAGRHYVFLPDGHGGAPREVSLGQASTEFVAIESGLAEGDSVLLAVSDLVKSKLPDLPPPDRAPAVPASVTEAAADAETDAPDAGTAALDAGTAALQAETNTPDAGTAAPDAGTNAQVTTDTEEVNGAAQPTADPVAGAPAP